MSPKQTATPIAPTEITLTLNLENANKVINALASQPFHLVADLISEIQRQASTQINPDVKA